MSESPETPQEGIAGALGDLSEQTRALARQEIQSAQQEMWAKAKQSAPAFGLAAAAAALGLLAAASSYRLSLRLLEKALPPATAALVAALGYGAGAACAAGPAIHRIRQLPPLFPTETARQTGRAVTDAAADARR